MLFLALMKKMLVELPITTSFKSTDRGEEAFYPWGIYGKGFVIASEKTREQICTFLKRHTLTMLLPLPFLLLLLCTAHASGFLRVDQLTFVVMVGILLALYLFGYFAFYAVWVRKLTKNLQPTTERLTRADIRQKMPSFRTYYRDLALAIHPIVLWSIVIANLIFLIVSIRMLWSDQELAGVFGTILFSGGLIAYAIMILVRANTIDGE